MSSGALHSIDPKFVGKLLFNILLFARNSNTNRVSSSNFPLCTTRNFKLNKSKKWIGSSALDGLPRLYPVSITSRLQVLHPVCNSSLAVQRHAKACSLSTPSKDINCHHPEYERTVRRSASRSRSEERRVGKVKEK